jgi:hypothetical protein
MEKLSVIIPTLFLAPRIYKTLIELSNCEFVGEIILIDNTQNNDMMVMKKLILEGRIDNYLINTIWN